MRLAVSILVFCVAGLLALGLVMLYSSSLDRHGAHFLGMQLIWCVIGLVCCGIAASLDYVHLKKVVFIALAVSAVTLCLVWVPKIGIYAGGAWRWIGYGGFRIQPSELAKLSILIFLAWYGERYQRQMHTWIKGLLIPGLVVAPFLALIFLEPDRGSTIFLGGLTGIILLVAGVRWSCLIPPALAGVAGLVYSIIHDPMRMGRVLSWMRPEDQALVAGHQALQAKLALGAGGWMGLGLGNSRQKLGFVPENHTDFILSVIGEELGFVATILIVIAFVAIFICGLYIAWRARDTFGMLLAVGISFTIALQAMVNIGVVSGALPNKGLPLPYISYGGSNLVVMLTCTGILLSIARRAADATAPRPLTEEADA